MRKQNTPPGFSLLELMIAMTVGLIVLGAATSLFRTGMNATFIVAQRAETQQNMRAAIDMMNKDIGLAGAGITGGVQLPLGGGGGSSKYGCDLTGTCYVVAHTYPPTNYLYGIVPGFNNGVQGGAVIPSAPAPAINDSITVIYSDYNFPLFNYIVTGFSAAGDQITIAPNGTVVPPPPLITAPGGIQLGDLVLLTNNLGSAVGEVTGFNTTTIFFANLDPLNFNQSGATSNNIKAIAGGANTSIHRLLAVTYYLMVPAGGQMPRLMRQVNALPPVPVADNIINLQFSYDTYNTTTAALDSNQPDPIGAGESPNLIQKINIVVMGQSMTPQGDRAQSMYLATSISARDMAFKNRYK
ncbi:MAG TPA: prepilin-type N-terminal cleavage/methylation domain-containing protein [Candidatus Sulfotelmatobacter sp.]|nr:prepilin-type N-terminal cleavage/methylation domain-containing protein [Candidatus Sulfotelmatobacter sp.]